MGWLIEVLAGVVIIGLMGVFLLGRLLMNMKKPTSRQRYEFKKGWNDTSDNN